MEARDSMLVDREAAIKLLKHYFSKAQQRMKSQADKHRNEREFS